MTAAEAGQPQYSGRARGRQVQLYRLPAPVPGDPAYVVVKPFQWEFALGRAVTATNGAVTSDAGIVKRFRHCFRPLPEGVA